jgi:hypothetical protein
LSVISGKSNESTKKFVLTRRSLAKLRLKARRRGVWFRDLKQNERRLLDLTIRVVQRVHSFLLARLISRIVDKLGRSMESRVSRLMRSEGRSLAEKLSRLGRSWGNRAAESWAEDSGFIQYLTVVNLLSFKT